VVIAIMFVTCSSSDPESDCPVPRAGSEAASVLNQARSRAGFTVLYPCQLPAGENLDTMTVVGQPGRQQLEFVFVGPFDLKVRQAQYPPAMLPDPAGASRSVVELFPNVRGTLIEVNDGTGKALYHLFWEQNGIFYEVQALGPPLQRRAVLLVATSLQ
jgi:hypothetical protein